jgi:hypothetical protein
MENMATALQYKVLGMNVSNDPRDAAEAIEAALNHWAAQGWELRATTFAYASFIGNQHYLYLARKG